MIYIMMMANDITTLLYEHMISDTVGQFRTYYKELGNLQYDLYFITGTFLPLLSLGSLTSVYFELKTFSKVGKWLIVVSTSICVLIVIWTTYRNVDYSGKLFETLDRFDKSDHQQPTFILPKP